MKALVIATLVAVGSFAWAHAGHEHDEMAMPKDFETMKKLVGTWEGSGKMEGKDTPIKVTYELTSGGTAIAEKIGPGTPHEMLTVYHPEGKSMGMTHYCAMGNQPHMVLKKSDAHMLAFEMDKPEGVKSMNEPHMHALTLTMADDNTLKQEWTDYANGKKKDTAVFTLKRTK